MNPPSFRSFAVHFLMSLAIALIITGLALIATAAPEMSEKRIGEGVQFLANHDGTIRPLLPADLVVVQETGDTPGAALTCDVFARAQQVIQQGEPRQAVETVLRCGRRRFTVKGLLFSRSGKF